MIFGICENCSCVNKFRTEKKITCFRCNLTLYKNGSNCDVFDDEEGIDKNENINNMSVITSES